MPLKLSTSPGICCLLLAIATAGAANPSCQSQATLTATDSTQGLSERQSYHNSHVTNDQDYGIRDDLDVTDRMLFASPFEALQRYAMLYEKHQSPRALFGLGRSHQVLASQSISEDVALNHENRALLAFCKVLQMESVPEFLVMQSGTECLRLARFKSLTKKYIKALQAMLKAFPHNKEYALELSWQQLLAQMPKRAVKMLQKMLQTDPGNATAKTILGLALLLTGDRQAEAEEYLRQGSVDLRAVQYYGMLATVLRRRGQAHLADRVYEAGFKNGLFMSKWQRSASDSQYHLRHLRGQPIWPLPETGYQKQLEAIQSHWQDIRDEALEALFGSKAGFREEAENLREAGHWQQMVLFENGQRIEEACLMAPVTCQLMQDELPSSAFDLTRGQIKLSVLYPGTHVWPHTGPTNTRLRAHLGLVVPDGAGEDVPHMRIAEEEPLHWKEGEIFVIDDSFEHEVWFNKTAGQDKGTFRLVLLLDLWHPEVSQAERLRLSPLPSQAEGRSPVFSIQGVLEKQP